PAKRRRNGDIQPAIAGGYILTGAKQKAANEPVRPLCEAVKPQTYIAYDRYADTYLRRPM
ncbi:MAG: hypothetical protein ACUVXA_14390, partial [Candidatus Jordarchaeum sp.]|uniref:hypothetical protein n=1 Tax=Candidatus Jordarchaeum sp. TaxID=2823881 RepID=UPI00404A0D98